MEEYNKGSRSISCDSSELTWDDIDERARKIGFKERSKYVLYAIEKEIHKGKINFRENLVIILLLFLAMCSLLILLKIGV